MNTKDQTEFTERELDSIRNGSREDFDKMLQEDSEEGVAFRRKMTNMISKGAKRTYITKEKYLEMGGELP